MGSDSAAHRRRQEPSQPRLALSSAVGYSGTDKTASRLIRQQHPAGGPGHGSARAAASPPSTLAEGGRRTHEATPRPPFVLVRIDRPGESVDSVISLLSD